MRSWADVLEGREVHVGTLGVVIGEQEENSRGGL
jgi:hypothetical protein